MRNYSEIICGNGAEAIDGAWLPPSHPFSSGWMALNHHPQPLTPVTGVSAKLPRPQKRHPPPSRMSSGSCATPFFRREISPVLRLCGFKLGLRRPSGVTLSENQRPPLWGLTIVHDHCRPLVTELVEVQADPERLMVGAEGEETAGGHRGSVTSRLKIAQNV